MQYGTFRIGKNRMKNALEKKKKKKIEEREQEGQT